MSDSFIWLDYIINIIKTLLFLWPFWLPILVSFIFFIVNLVRFFKTPKEDIEKRKSFRKSFISSLILTVVFAAIDVLLVISFLTGIDSM